MKKTAIYQQKRTGAPGWYNVWVQSPRSLATFGIAAGICVLLYLASAFLGAMDPGSAWGMGFGIGAAVLLVALSLYGLRRRVVRLPRFQRVWFFLQFHVYGGVLFLLLVLMHTNFQVPRGTMTWWLWALSIWLVGTGLIGSALQKWIPRLINGGLANEVPFQRIPALLETLQKDAASLADGSTDKVRAYYLDYVEASLGALRPRFAYFVDPSGYIQRKSAFFDAARAYVTGEERDQLDTLARIYRTKLELDAHFTLQRALRTWLYLHLPVAMVVLALLVAHVVTVMYY